MTNNDNYYPNCTFSATFPVLYKRLHTSFWRKKSRNPSASHSRIFKSKRQPKEVKIFAELTLRADKASRIIAAYFGWSAAFFGFAAAAVFFFAAFAWDVAAGAALDAPAVAVAASDIFPNFQTLSNENTMKTFFLPTAKQRRMFRQRSDNLL